MLKQNAGKPDSQARIVSDIERFRDRHIGDPTVPLARARRQAPSAFERLVRSVEWKLIEMPLRRLQIIGGQEDPFLYTIAWDQSIQRSAVRGYEKGEASFDNRILLRPNVGEYLGSATSWPRPSMWPPGVAASSRARRSPVSWSSWRKTRRGSRSGIARSASPGLIYLHLPERHKLWVRGREFDDIDRAAVNQALA